MYLNELYLKYYRNYSELLLQFGRQITLLVGANAQGKTNLLESILLMAVGKSHRTNHDKELIQWDQEFALVKGQFSNRYNDFRAEIQLTAKGKKAKINGIEKKKLSDYVGAINVVLFAPEDLNLVTGPPAQRRRFMDMEIGQVSSPYLYYLTQYNKLLNQRNQFLKDYYTKKMSLDLLDVWDEQLSELAAKIILRRKSFVTKLQRWANIVHQNITQGKETLSIDYHHSLCETPDLNETNAKELFMQELMKHREKELNRGTTMTGPHRDDLKFFVNNINVQQFGSQGQKRTTALSLKLAEIELMKEEVGEYPILLLDDVLSELDENRQSHLLYSIQEKVQTFVTTTGVEGLRHKALEHAVILYVSEGTIKK